MEKVSAPPIRDRVVSDSVLERCKRIHSAARELRRQSTGRSGPALRWHRIADIIRECEALAAALEPLQRYAGDLWALADAAEPLRSAEDTDGLQERVSAAAAAARKAFPGSVD